MIEAIALIIAYLLGSIPTAVIVSKRFKGVDIRTLGDGNMGARNVSRTLGENLGVMVAMADFFKGALPVLLAQVLGLTLSWQLLTGICAILGHDFPVFAKFRGGQGFATTLGTMLVLFPAQALLGFIVYGSLYLITKKSDLSAGIGGGLIALLLSLAHKWIPLAYAVGTFLFIPLKKWLDSHRRKETEAASIKETSS